MPNYKDFDLDIQKKRELPEIKDLNRKDANARYYSDRHSYCETSCDWAGTMCNY